MSVGLAGPSDFGSIHVVIVANITTISSHVRAERDTGTEQAREGAGEWVATNSDRRNDPGYTREVPIGTVLVDILFTDVVPSTAGAALSGAGGDHCLDLINLC